MFHFLKLYHTSPFEHNEHLELSNSTNPTKEERGKRERETERERERDRERGAERERERALSQALPWEFCLRPFSLFRASEAVKVFFFIFAFSRIKKTI